MRLQAPVDPFDQRFRRKLLFLVHQLTLVVNSQQVLHQVSPRGDRRVGCRKSPLNPMLSASLIFVRI
jgi:hypothetical protein